MPSPSRHLADMFDELLKSAAWGIRLLQKGVKKADDGSGPVAIVPIVEAATLAAWSVSGALVEAGIVTRDDVRRAPQPSAPAHPSAPAPPR